MWTLASTDQLPTRKNLPVTIVDPSPPDPTMPIMQMMSTPFPVSGTADDGVDQVYVDFVTASGSTRATAYPTPVSGGLWSACIPFRINPGDSVPGTVRASNQPLIQPPPACDTVDVTVNAPGPDCPPTVVLLLKEAGAYPAVEFLAPNPFPKPYPDQSCVAIPRLILPGKPPTLYRYEEFFFRTPAPVTSLVYRYPPPGLYMAHFMFLSWEGGIQMNFAKLVK